MLRRSGSLHVTSASDPARLLTIRCAASRILCSSCTFAKSFITSSFALMHAIVTERSTTGWMISRIARSTATGTRLDSCGCCWKSVSELLILMYAARFGISVGGSDGDVGLPPAPVAGVIWPGESCDAVVRFGLCTEAAPRLAAPAPPMPPSRSSIAFGGSRRLKSGFGSVGARRFATRPRP